MPTSKRAPSRKPRTKKGKGSKRGKTKARDWSGTFLGAHDRVAEAVTWELIGGFLLVAGLFFSASFFSGRGAVLGEYGLLAATYLIGQVGIALAPIAAVGGLGRVGHGRSPCGAPPGAAVSKCKQ